MKERQAVPESTEVRAFAALQVFSADLIGEKKPFRLGEPTEYMGIIVEILPPNTMIKEKGFASKISHWRVKMQVDGASEHLRFEKPLAEVAGEAYVRHVLVQYFGRKVVP